MKLTATFLLLCCFFAMRAIAGSSPVHDACKRLCENEGDCVRRCVSHAELMEARAELVNVAADFHKEPETRLTALRTGASLETFSICGKTGWSTANKLICLRSYPTAEIVKSCKALSPREADQVECVRNGKTSAEVEVCIKMLVSADVRLQCVGLQVPPKLAEGCDRKGLGSLQRLECLKTRSNRVPASR